MTKKDGGLVLALSIFLIIAAIVGRKLFDDSILIYMLVVNAVLVLAALLEAYRRLHVEQIEIFREQEVQRYQDYRQLESMLSLFFTLKPNLPIPDTRGWAASPDLLKKLTELMLIEKPTLVVEASSGVSTLVIAYCLKRLGRGRVVSLEHDAKYAASSQGLISSHGLADIATVIHAPLKVYEIGGQQWKWYDTNCFDLEQAIELLVIDGPPGSIQRLSRYPALPLLFQHLAENVTVVLDDGRRKDEEQIVRLWKSEFPELEVEYFELEKGAYKLRRRSRGAEEARAPSESRSSAPS